MAKRDLTLAEIQTMMESIKDYVTEEGMELYEDLKLRISSMVEKTTAEINSEFENNLYPRLNDLREKIKEGGGEALDMIQMKLDDIYDEIQEELEEEYDELKEVGPIEWVKLNPGKAAQLGLVVALIVFVIVALF